MTDMAQQQGGVYVQGTFSEPMSAQHNFARQFDLDHPRASMARYNQIMHQHTKQQLDSFTGDVRRRSSASFDGPATLSNQPSVESVSSTGS